MNVVQSLIIQLMAHADSIKDPGRRDMTKFKIEELQAWLVWCGVQQNAGQVPEIAERAGLPVSADEFLEIWQKIPEGRILPEYPGLVTEDNMREAVGISVGAASGCWENMMETGLFDSVNASKIVDELLDVINRYANTP